MEVHLRIGGPEFRKFAELLDLRSIDVYGDPSETVLEQLGEKARMLGRDGRVVVHELQACRRMGRAGEWFVESSCARRRAYRGDPNGDELPRLH